MTTFDRLVRGIDQEYGHGPETTLLALVVDPDGPTQTELERLRECLGHLGATVDRDDPLLDLVHDLLDTTEVLIEARCEAYERRHPFLE